MFLSFFLSMQIYYDKVTEWALTLSGSTVFRQALTSLETDPGLHPLVPFFTCFIAEEVVFVIQQFESWVLS